jgi:hypothetical protein
MTRQSFATRSILWVMLALGPLLPGCAPANDFSGKWFTNIGVLTVSQSGASLTGNIAGYGGYWNQSFQGVLVGNGASFDTSWFGNFTLVVSASTFKSRGAALSFCGINSVLTDVLPDGCGFSGKWGLQTDAYPSGSYMVLKQTAEVVTGTVLDPTDHPVDAIGGKVEWGKGWRMVGRSTQTGALALNITSDETGFEYAPQDANAASNQNQCGVRAGLQKAYVFFFWCIP